MPNELRVRSNFLGGSVEDNPLASTATTLTSTALSVAPVIGTTQHMPITLDPDGFDGPPEIAWITAHASGANTATLLRGQEGTAARLCYQDTPWVHGPSVLDIGKNQTNTARDLAQANLTGGGVVTWDGANLKWTSRFISISVGSGTHWATNGYLDINQPTSGTIPVYPGVGTVTATASGVPLGVWRALYAIPTIGVTNAGSVITFAEVDYNAGAFIVPDHWILLASQNGDDSRVRLGTGEILDYWRYPTLTNAWVDYSANYRIKYRKDGNNRVQLGGLGKLGTMNTSAFQLPIGYRPLDLGVYYACHSRTGASYIYGMGYVNNNGNVIPYSGGTDEFSFAGISFIAEQ